MSVDSDSRAMKSSIEVHSGPLSMFGAKAEMAAIEKGISWKRIFVPFSLSTFYQPTSSEVLDLVVTTPDIAFFRPVDSHVEAY